jgi:ABC-type lipoprotein export system ATPase subunit
MPSPIILAKKIYKTYQNNTFYVNALNSVDITLPQGALAMIYGPSGGGKSTLLHVIGGIDRVQSGYLEVDGVCLHAANEKQLTQFRRDKTGFVFQFYNLLPSLNALDNVCLPLLAKGESIKQARRKGLLALQQVGLIDRQRHRPGQLSGGEQQRVAVARALIVEPALVLADEPTGDLDSRSTNELMELIISLNQNLGITFLIATHNIDIRSAATHLFEMRDGILKMT